MCRERYLLPLTKISVWDASLYCRDGRREQSQLRWKACNSTKFDCKWSTHTPSKSTQNTPYSPYAPYSSSWSYAYKNQNKFTVSKFIKICNVLLIVYIIIRVFISHFTWNICLIDLWCIICFSKSSDVVDRYKRTTWKLYTYLLKYDSDEMVFVLAVGRFIKFISCVRACVRVHSNIVWTVTVSDREILSQL